MSKRIIVSGGAGYIGSHICIDLLTAGRDILVIDNFANSSPRAIERIQAITNKTFTVLNATLGDENDEAAIFNAIDQFQPDSAIHLAGLKAVGESVAQPLEYYRTNIGATITLLKAMDRVGANRLVFSSSATVYGDHNKNPVDETGKVGPANPYGRTKLFIEEILRDYVAAQQKFSIVNLRYFNPAGAHSSGKIGEDPDGVPNNLFPYIAQVAVGKRKNLSVFGDDYATPDGSGVRDYIHVCDLARGHLNALDFLAAKEGGISQNINLGTGIGYSVFDVINAFKRNSNQEIPFNVVPRREGDVAEIFAKPDLAKKLLGWSADKSLDDMCADTWRWQQNNPNGYRD